MRIRKQLLLFFLALVSGNLAAQDFQLSQYYNSPLYLNPAFTGTAENARGVVNYRNQWTSLPSPFVTFAASFDHFIGPYNSGVGMLVTRDRQGDAGLTSTSVNLLYSYHVWLSEGLTFIPAVQVGYVNRSVNYFDLVFGDQLTSNGASGVPTTDAFPSGPKLSYLDVSGGGLLYGDRFWLGISTHHLNKPNQALAGTYKLPVKFSFHGGYKIFMEKPSRTRPGMYQGWSKEKSIIPTFMYKSQGLYDQLDLGVYAIYEPLMFGMWYRGIPVKKYKEGLNNHESLVFMAGVHYQGLSFGYSYDLTISSFKPGSGGSHEISVIYEWEIPYPNYKPKKHRRKVTCPKFYR